MTQASKGIMNKFLASLLTLTPLSMASERAVSHYNNIKTVKRAILKQKTVNGVILMSLHGNGTEFYDPWPAVFQFLRMKERPIRQHAMNFTETETFLESFFKRRKALFSSLCFSKHLAFFVKQV